MLGSLAPDLLKIGEPAAVVAPDLFIGFAR
jgi:hypothetical protein